MNSHPPQVGEQPHKALLHVCESGVGRTVYGEESRKESSCARVRMKIQVCGKRAEPLMCCSSRQKQRFGMPAEVQALVEVQQCSSDLAGTPARSAITAKGLQLES